LAWRTLSQRSTGAGTVWTIGLIGTALGLVSSGWLTRFAELMTLIGSILVPVGGVFLAHFVILRRPLEIDALYDLRRVPAVSIAGIAAWSLGFFVYKLAAPVGATLPALATSIAAYLLLHRIHIGVTRVKS
jgi:purine-cytosine permease-like protein